MIENIEKTVCVFCGSGNDIPESHKTMAKDLGALLGELDLQLVYGGGDLGLMGILAQSAITHNVEVYGVMPEFLNTPTVVQEANYKLIVTPSMHERKKMIFENSQYIIALPGGVGTLEELTEVITWKQLGQNEKKIIIVNVDGYWDPLLSLFEHMRSEGYVHKGHDFRVNVVSSIEEVRELLSS